MVSFVRPAARVLAGAMAAGAVGVAMLQYMDANPQTHADLEGIRQPLTDFQSRVPLTEGQPAGGCCRCIARPLN